MKRYLYTLFFFFTWCRADLSFVPKTFDEFCVRMVTHVDRSAFVQFYQDQMDRLKGLAQAKRQTAVKEIQDMALCALEVRHPAWAKEVKPLLQQGIDRKQAAGRQLNNFLMYYGMHEQFWTQSGAARTSIWVKARTRCSEFGNRIATWWNSTTWSNSWRGQKTS